MLINIVNHHQTLEMWSANFLISSNNTANQAAIFAIIIKKLYIPLVVLSTDDNA